MAKIFRFVSWIFCLRPLTWFFSKIFKNKTVLGFILEIFYLGMAILYFVLTLVGIRIITSDNPTDFAIVALVIGIPGMLMLGYGIMKYHKTDEAMSEDTFKGYEGTASYNEYDDSVTVSVGSKWKEEFTIDALIAIFTAPFQIIIRSINFLLMFRCVFNDEYVCDLAYNCHPDEDGPLKAVLIDIVNYNRY